MTAKSRIQRLRIISLLIVFSALVFTVKLYYMQVVQHDEFVNLADKQYVKQNSTIFSRGTIYFEDKSGNLVSAATLKSGFILAINPKLIKDKETVFEQISKIIPIDKVVFLAKASKVDDPYEELAKKIPEDMASALKREKIAGVLLLKEQWRFYPGGNSASQVIGLLGFKGDEYGARYGLEKQYDNVLSRNQNDIYANFFVEIFSNIKKSVSEDASFEGDIVATIEPSVETSLEDTLQKIQEKWQSTETGGIIMNPKTGEIYAMASYPSFDLNDFQGEKNVNVFSNPSVENEHEMGSIIKPLTMAAGIDAGIVTPKTTYIDEGSITSNNKTVYNHDRLVNGKTTMQEVLNKSLNTGAAFVETKLGNDRFADYMFGYGLGEKTGIDLPNEASNIVGNLKSPRDIEYITASFGQGIALTPIATIRALATLANNGTLVTPHVIKKINYSSGFFNNITLEQGKQVIKPESAKKITEMLVSLVDTALLGGREKNEHYSIAAKTGTAQIAKPEGGGYYDDRYLHSFVGYFPAYDPKFIILLYTYNPKSNNFAADTLSKPFFDLSKFLINYYQIPPDR